MNSEAFTFFTMNPGPKLWFFCNSSRKQSGSVPMSGAVASITKSLFDSTMLKWYLLLCQND